MTDYPGIDYSLGQANVDQETGIHYGVIALHELLPEAADDIFTTGDDLGFEEMQIQAKADLAAAIASAVENYGSVDAEKAAEEIIDNLEWHDCMGVSGPYEYSSEGITVRTMSDNTEIFVLKSPYYTHSQFCSPCAPGAGYLMNPCPDGPRTYCLGHDWFEGRKAPYPVYSVETGELVEE
jgi:hypothetical protein